MRAHRRPAERTIQSQSTFWRKALTNLVGGLDHGFESDITCVFNFVQKKGWICPMCCRNAELLFTNGLGYDLGYDHGLGRDALRVREGTLTVLTHRTGETNHTEPSALFRWRVKAGGVPPTGPQVSTFTSCVSALMAHCGQHELVERLAAWDGAGYAP